MKTLRFIVFFLAMAGCLFSPFSYAQTLTSNCSKGYVIAFFNGIQVSYLESGEAILRLKDEFGTTYNNQPLVYRRFYNPTVSLLNDLAESYKQANQGNPQLLSQWERLSAALAPSKYDAIFAPNLTAAQGGAGTEVVRLISEAIVRAAPAPIEADLKKQMNALIDEKQKVVAVAHSQGNWFANAVFNDVAPRLAQPNPITVKFVHVASFTDVGTRPLFNLDLDQVLTAARLINLPGVPGTTINWGSRFLRLYERPIYDTTPDVFYHGFLTAYLNPAYKPYLTVRAGIADALRTVQDYKCSNVVVTPSSAKLAVGGTSQFMAILKDDSGNVVSPQPTFNWSSSDIAVASVSSTGMVTGIAQGGPVTITASDPQSNTTGTAVVNVGSCSTPTFNSITFEARPEVGDIGIFYRFSCVTTNLLTEGTTTYSYMANGNPVTVTNSGSGTFNYNLLSGPLDNQVYVGGGFSSTGFLSYSVTLTVTFPDGSKVTRSASY